MFTKRPPLSGTLYLTAIVFKRLGLSAATIGWSSALYAYASNNPIGRRDLSGLRDAPMFQELVWGKDEGEEPQAMAVETRSSVPARSPEQAARRAPRRHRPLPRPPSQTVGPRTHLPTGGKCDLYWPVVPGSEDHDCAWRTEAERLEAELARVREERETLRGQLAALSSGVFAGSWRASCERPP